MTKKKARAAADKLCEASKAPNWIRLWLSKAEDLRKKKKIPKIGGMAVMEEERGGLNLNRKSQKVRHKSSIQTDVKNTGDNQKNNNL